MATLQDIRLKIRRLTRSPSSNQITDAEIDSYINTFILYDIPAHVRLFSLKTTHTFYTQPGQDIYPTDADQLLNVQENPLYDFNNRYISVHTPVFSAGYEIPFFQSRGEFYRLYPLTKNIIDTNLTGNGVQTMFTGTIGQVGQVENSVIVQNETSIYSIDSDGMAVTMVDQPLVDATTGLRQRLGNLYRPGNVPVAPTNILDPNNSINYDTGDFTVTFINAPAVNEPIRANILQRTTSRPNVLLYYNNKFIVRPVPDRVYDIAFSVYQRPTELINANDIPQLEQWWQWIAYGAAKKVFEDRLDLESVQLIMPEYKMQEKLVLRRTLVQQSEFRTPTIYESGSSGIYGYGGNFNSDIF